MSAWYDPSSRASMRSGEESTTTSCCPIASKSLASSSPARPKPATRKNGSRMRPTLRVKPCSATACWNARSCSSVSSEPIAYAQPITEA